MKRAFDPRPGCLWYNAVNFYPDGKITWGPKWDQRLPPEDMPRARPVRLFFPTDALDGSGWFWVDDQTEEEATDEK